MSVVVNIDNDGVSRRTKLKVEGPWEKLGFAINNSMTPVEMLEASHNNWSVVKSPIFTTIGEEKILLDVHES